MSEHATRTSAGLQELLSRAASDAKLRRRLLSDPEAAANASGVELTGSERALLASVSPDQLERLIANTPPPAPRRRRFLQVAAGWLAALVGGSALFGGCGGPDEQEQPEPDPVRGSRPDPPAPMGIRPD